MQQYEFQALGKSGVQPSKSLETFPSPGVNEVTFTTDEFTSLCPITGQPDYSSVSIEYSPSTVCLESKSLKLYLASFRNEGAFCEALAVRIADDLQAVLDARRLEVRIDQHARGGIRLTSVALRRGGSK